MSNHFSENLKKIRKDNNLSQEQLADELGVSRQAISKWESAAAYPEMDKIIALCDKFNLNIDDLLHKDIREIKGEDESKKKLNRSINDFLKFTVDTINLFSSMSFKSKMKCLFEQVVIIGILFIISLIIVGLGKSFFYNVLSFMPKIGYFICNILEFVLIMFCIISSIIILSHIFKTRYLDYYDDLKVNMSEDIDTDKKDKISLKENKIIIRDPKHSEYRFINGLFKFIIGIIKFFALGFVLFLSMILIGLFCLFIISFLVYKTGFFFIGVLGTILSSSVIDIILILIILNFVFNRKNDKKRMIWSFIVSLMVLGVSMGMIFIGTLNFEVANDKMLKTNTARLEMNDNIFFNTSEDIKYEVSDIDNIKVQYKVNKYCEAKLDEHGGYGVHIWAYCSNPIKLMGEYIRNINDKKLVSLDNEIFDITIYASKENIDKIKNNEIKFYEEQKVYDETISSYENRISELEEEIETLENKAYDYEDKISNLKDDYEEKILSLKEQISEYKTQIKELEN